MLGGPVLSTQYLKNDLVAGVVVFLVALPLCLGVALASDAPLFSGIISGIVGGLIVTVFSGSALGVSGPAAGLAVMVAAAIGKLGFEAFLLSVVICGVVQVVAGFLRAGIISHYFPTSVIKGMLAGIGVILILKQIPHALGNDTSWMGEMEFAEGDGHNTFTELYYSIVSIHPGAVLIAAVSLLILIAWQRPVIQRIKVLKSIPAPLVVVFIGTLMNELFTTWAPDLVLGATHLVNLPVPGSMRDFFSFFTLPDFGQLTNMEIYTTGFTLAVIASIESLLSVEATDKLDRLKRITPTNRELKAQGAGNILAGLIGGIPVTQVIVRSAANVGSGGKTRFASFFHGVLLLICALFFAGFLNKIPLSCLAAILLVVGYKLTRITTYREMYRQGWQQFFPFIATVVGLVFTDMLTGVMLGMVVGAFHILVYNYKTDYLAKIEPEKRRYTMRLSEHMSFLNKASLTKALREPQPGCNVTIDGSNSVMIDYDVREVLKNFLIRAKAEGIEVTLMGLDEEEILNLPSSDDH